jgi:hypothetical protein
MSFRDHPNDLNHEHKRMAGVVHGKFNPLVRGEIMSVGKMKVSKHGKFAVSVHVSDAWYEVVDETKCYQHASITHRVKDGVLIMSAVLLFFKFNLFIRLKDTSNATNQPEGATE